MKEHVFSFMCIKEGSFSKWVRHVRDEEVSPLCPRAASKGKRWRCNVEFAKLEALKRGG